MRKRIIRILEGHHMADGSARQADLKNSMLMPSHNHGRLRVRSDDEEVD